MKKAILLFAFLCVGKLNISVEAQHVFFVDENPTSNNRSYIDVTHDTHDGQIRIQGCVDVNGNCGATATVNGKAEPKTLAN